jgi:hypothetical protein
MSFLLSKVAPGMSSTLLCAILSAPAYGQACVPTSSSKNVVLNACTFPEGANLDQNYKVAQFTITWPDGAVDQQNNNGYGQCIRATLLVFLRSTTGLP